MNCRQCPQGACEMQISVTPCSPCSTMLAMRHCSAWMLAFSGSPGSSMLTPMYSLPDVPLPTALQDALLWVQSSYGCSVELAVGHSSPHFEARDIWPCLISCRQHQGVQLALIAPAILRSWGRVCWPDELGQMALSEGQRRAVPQLVDRQMAIGCASAVSCRSASQLCQDVARPRQHGMACSGACRWCLGMLGVPTPVGGRFVRGGQHQRLAEQAAAQSCAACWIAVLSAET